MDRQGNSFFTLRLIVLAAALIVASGCGSATLKPVIPVNVPLTPTVIYVPECAGRESGLLEAMGAADAAWGRSVCAALKPALVARVAGDDHRFRLVEAKPNIDEAPVDRNSFSKLLHAINKRAEQAFNIVPDVGVEKSLGARYRVVLKQPASYRVYNDNMSYVVAGMGFEIVDVSSNEVILRSSLQPDGAGGKGAASLADRLIRGLVGPRCETLNGWSAAGVIKDPWRNKCDTFALPGEE